MRVPISLAGETGGHRSTQFGSEVTRNMYIDEAEGRLGVHDFPGLKVWAQKNGTDRGWHVMAKVLYKLISNTLWRIDSNGVYTSLGSVTGSDRGVFADDGTNLYFTANNKLWKYDATTVAEVTQSVVTNPSAIAYINRQFILSGDNGTFATSDVADGDTYNALNVGQAETKPDPLVIPYTFSQLVYMLGEETTELWYNSGSGNPPFERRDTSLVNVGIAGKHAITNTDTYLYWLGDDRKVYQVTGSNSRPINSVAFSNAIESLSDVSDCIASRFVLQGQDFVLFTFSGQSWLYSEKGYWVELAAGTDPSRAKWYANAVIWCYQKNLASGGGDVLELDLNTYTDNDNTRLRIRTLPNIDGDLIGSSGKQVTVSQVRINMQLGVGLATGQGSAPELMCQMSPDGGESWQAEQLVSIGTQGDYKGPVDFWDFCTGYDVRVRIKCSDPVYLSMFDGFVELVDAGY